MWGVLLTFIIFIKFLNSKFFLKNFYFDPILKIFSRKFLPYFKKSYYKLFLLHSWKIQRFHLILQGRKEKKQKKVFFIFNIFYYITLYYIIMVVYNKR